MYEHIPNELKELPNWVNCASDKIPRDPKNGGNAKTNDKTTWGTFAQAVDAMRKYGFSHIGFVFDGKHEYFGVDLDHCLSNTDFCDEFVNTLQSYAEISRSGDGLHIICKGTLPEGAKRRGGIEMYSFGRYFIMTGNIYNAQYNKVVDCTEKIKILHSKYLFSETPKIAPKQFERITMDDQEVIDKARSCKTGNLFQLLYLGNWEGLYSSQSEADLAFCNHLAFWTQKDSVQMDRIFRSSGLMRDKWDKKRGSLTYGQITIQKAIANCAEVYEPKLTEDDTRLAIGMFRNGNVVRQDVPKNQYDMTDTGNAQRLRDKYKGNIRYSYTRKKWMYWTGKAWRFDETGEIKKLADIVVEDLKREAFDVEDEKEQEQKLRFASKTANSSGKCNMIVEAQHLEGIPVMMDELDAYTDYLNVQNGIVNLRNGELMPHDPNFMMSKICNAEYDNVSGKRPEKWLKFIDDITNGDKELQHYLQKCVGYSLTGSVKEQCAFFLYGIGNNGKSTFLETIADMMGDYASNAQPDTVMMKRDGGSGINSDIARLKSARMVTTEEPTEGVRLNEGLVKQLTGGGKVTCRFLFGDEFEYEPEFKIWIATNHKPVIRGTDVGIWRRIRLIPFEVNITHPDKQLRYKMREEMPQIMKWAVDGCIMYHREGLEPPESVKKSTEEYKSEMDLLATFMEACITIDYTVKEPIPANELYAVYQAWANENNEYIMTSRKFFLEITKKIPDKQRISTGIVYKNVAFNNFAEKYKKPKPISIGMFK